MKLSEINAANVIDWGVDTSGDNYVKRKDLVKLGNLPLKGMYINTKSNFGDQGVYVVEMADGTIAKVDAPQHHTERIKECLADPANIQEIKDGKWQIKCRPYESNKFGTCYDIDLIESAQPDFQFKI